MDLSLWANRLMASFVTVRKAYGQDASKIADCLASAFEPFRSQYTREAFEDTVLTTEGVWRRMRLMTVYVACVPNGDVVGTVASCMDGAVGHLRGMAVVAEWQGHSIAEELLRVAEGDLVSAGGVELTLDTTIPLQRAIRFYQRHGFVSSGKITDFFGMPLYEFVKAIGSASPMQPTAL